MIIIFALCLGILTARPGCVEHRVPVLDEAVNNPFACNIKGQELVAERHALEPDSTVARWGCRRRPTA